VGVGGGGAAHLQAAEGYRGEDSVVLQVTGKREDVHKLGRAATGVMLHR
jgi:hypothetical protein